MSYGVKSWDVGKLYKAQDAGMRVPMSGLLGIPGDAAAMPRPVVPTEERPNNLAAIAGGFSGPIGVALKQLKDLYELTGVVKHPMEVYRGNADPKDVSKALGMAGMAMTGGVPTGVSGTGTVLGAGPTWKSGFSGIKHSRPLEEMTSTHVPSGRPIQPEKPLSIEALEGAYVQGMPGDRTPAGVKVTHVGETKLPWESEMLGGGDYMRTNPEAWRSGQSVITNLDNKITEAAKTGKDVFGVHVGMGQSSGDFSHMPADVLLGMTRMSKVQSEAMQKWDDFMRSQHPDWAGTASDLARHQLRTNPGKRMSFTKGMDQSEWRKMGFPDVAEARVATTKPEYIHAPTGFMGNVARMQPGGQVPNPKFEHPSYPIGLGGRYEGTLQGVHRDEFFRDWRNAQKLLDKRGNPITEANLNYSFDKAKPIQYVDPQLVDTLMELQLKRKRGLIP